MAKFTLAMKQFCIKHSGRTSGDDGFNLRMALAKEFKIKNKKRDLPTAGNIKRFIDNWSLTGNTARKARKITKRKKFLEIVSKSLEDKPNESYRRLTLRLSKEHGRIGKTTLWRIKRKDLQMYPYRQKKVQKVTKPSANLRLSYCVKISTFKDDCIFFLRIF